MAFKKTIAIVGTLDTKECEAFYLRDRIRQEGCEALIIDVSCGDSQPILGQPDITQKQVSRAAGVATSHVSKLERSAAADTMGRGVEIIVRQLYKDGRIQGALGYGGSSGAMLASRALNVLPIGFPKYIVTTSVEGAAKFVGEKDIVIVSSIADFAGGTSINKIEATVLANAAAAVAGMVKTKKKPRKSGKRTVIATQMGVTTPCVSFSKSILEERDYDMTTFHAIGSGGRMVEALVAEGYAAGVLDITLAEISNELVGGVCAAGADRLTAAGREGVPQVISPGALDLVNFWGPAATHVPEKFKDRLFYYHNPMVTLMRVSREESAELGKIIAEKINQAKGPTSIIIPRKGWSAYDKSGGPKAVDYYGNQTSKDWYDPAADDAFVQSLETHLDLFKSNVELTKVNKHINDPGFARLLVEKLDQMINKRWRKEGGQA